MKDVEVFHCLSFFLGGVSHLLQVTAFLFFFLFLFSII